jgi:hypothetical protein
MACSAPSPRHRLIKKQGAAEPATATKMSDSADGRGFRRDRLRALGAGPSPRFHGNPGTEGITLSRRAVQTAPRNTFGGKANCTRHLLLARSSWSAPRERAGTSHWSVVWVPGVGWHANGNITLPTMKVVCAWCLREGKPGDLGEREPLEDPGVTHSICAGHTDQLLEALPSRSFPEAALLIVVRRNDTALYEHLEWSFTAVPGVKVIVDRKTADRRSAQDPVRDDRRRVSKRRIRQGDFSGRRLHGCAVHAASVTSRLSEVFASR